MDSITEKSTSFLGTALTAGSAQELLQPLQAAIEEETTYWINLPAEADDKMKMYLLVEHSLNALKHETNATKDIANAIQAEAAGLVADASIYYTRAHTDLNFALLDWQFAIPEVADDSPFDTYEATTAERKQRTEAGHPNLHQPARNSHADLLEISPMLHHIYVSMDRAHCLALSLTQYQMAHLTTYLIEAEHRSAAHQIEAKAEQA